MRELVTTSRRYYPNEFGGLLVGRYSDDLTTCFIEANIVPKDYKSSRFTFERGKKGVVEKLEYYYNQVPKLLYIGEWHTHPDGLPIPSVTDRLAMKQIATDDKVTIVSPVLLIIGLFKEYHQLGVFVQFKDQLYKYEQ